MNIALIIAGGSGQRMNQDIPKQFLNVYDKPILMYTLEAFQNHPGIDEIGVVCIDGWQPLLAAYAKQYNISKLAWVIIGGENGQASIRNGVLEAEKRYGSDSNDTILVHDAIRPIVSQEIISDCIITCEKHGSAIVVLPCNTVVLQRISDEYSEGIVPRENLAITQTPQAFPLKKLVWAHKEALSRGIENSVASCTLMIELGEKVFFSKGSEKNIKITTVDDIEIFKALLNVKKDESLK